MIEREGTLKFETIAGKLVAGQFIAALNRFCWMNDLTVEIHSTPMLLQTQLLVKVTGKESYLRAITDWIRRVED